MADSAIIASKEIGASGRKRTIISLADLLPAPEVKRRRRDEAAAEAVASGDALRMPTTGELVMRAAAGGGSLSVMFGDTVRLNGHFAADAALEGLHSRAAVVERRVRAALPRVFGEEAREEYEEKTGNFGRCKEKECKAEVRLRELLPHLFGNDTGKSLHIKTSEQLSTWLQTVGKRLDAAEGVTAIALEEVSSCSDGE
mmetsp:Transcript_118899/g.236927  ORF Transcript_118899/g.236927 Transcript_118899/m.236927 type:complete len:199 (-) Transcript_118899:108-704(-)